MTHGYYSHCCIPATASPKCCLSEWWSGQADESGRVADTLRRQGVVATTSLTVSYTHLALSDRMRDEACGLLPLEVGREHWPHRVSVTREGRRGNSRGLALCLLYTSRCV